ncbi:MAG: hypothetical protein ACR2MB_12525 [Acidimicrobiales bacterium]
MRATVDLEPELCAEARAEAQRSRVSVSAIVNDALRKSLCPVPPVEQDPLNGIGVVRLGYPVTADGVADAIEN